MIGIQWRKPDNGWGRAEQGADTMNDVERELIAAIAIMQARGISAPNIVFDRANNLPTWTDALRDARAVIAALTAPRIAAYIADKGE